ncbi:MAG: hypothetical protein DMF79_12295 [Acidobacteria bacterium]|nr:MAG: hypothetical protein DMF79_12295 [Acidobacteriota bacterium]
MAARHGLPPFRRLLMTTVRRLRWVIPALFVVQLASGRAAAQSTGTLSGTVVDEASQVVPGATVTLVDEHTGVSRRITSDGRGDFSFKGLEAGTYTVRIELPGFRALERKGNVLNASSQLALGNLKLAVGAMSEVLTVEVQGTKVETTNSDHTGLLTSKQIEQIQTKGRDLMNLLRLVPGVKYEDDLDAMGQSFGSTVPHVNGMRQHWNQVTVDGLNGNELSGTNRFSSAINLDAIEEVKVMLNTYKAELGRTGGANIQVVTKGGGAEYRGNAYWYGRREGWNANRWENNKNMLPRPVYHFDTYGFNFGGPVRIPGLYDQGGDKKLFFFYSLEAPQVQNPGPLRQFRMPTEAERNGDFSHTLDTNGRLVVIKDPLTGQAFPNNVIPANRIDPSTRALLGMLPLPNRLESPTPALSSTGSPRPGTASRSAGGSSPPTSTAPRSRPAPRSGGSSTRPTSSPTIPSTWVTPTSSARASSTSSEWEPGAPPKGSRPRATATGAGSAGPTWVGASPNPTRS